MSTAAKDPRHTLAALLGWLWSHYLKRYWVLIVIALALMVIEGSALGLMSWMVQPLFDKVFVGGDMNALWWVGGLFAGLFAVRGMAGVIQNIMMTWVAEASTAQLQTDLVGHLLRLDSLFFQDNAPGALMERVQGDTLAIQGVWQTLIRGVGRDAITLVALLAVVVLIDPVWTLVAAVGVPLLVLPTLMVQRYVRKKTGFAREIATQRATRLDEIFHGINPIKLNAMESYQHDRYARVVRMIRGAQVKSAAGRATVPGMVDIVTGIGLFGILIFAGGQIASGEKSLGQFMSFFTAMGLAFQPLRRLGAIAGILQVAAASLERIHRLFDVSPGIVSSENAVAQPSDTTIVFDQVDFAYGGGDTPVLRGASFTAPSGKTTALVGASGAGKSTIFNVLTRLVDADGGSVTIGGVPVSDIDLAALRGMFSVVAQDSLLFDETVRENILLGRTDVSEDQLQKVLEAAQVANFISRLPDGLDTRAGPRGSNLSGGQRQRVAIARALLRDSPILLLDEATSALDTASEAAVQQALDQLSQNRTTLVIAHRLSTVREADSIVVMDRGQVVDQGSHDELLKHGGLYAQLYALQFRDADSETA